MKKLFLFLIQFYKKYLSPLKSTRCPYYPSCSSYGMEAIERFGVVRGGCMTLWRILRCNPFSQGGYDPVPLMKNPKGKEHKKEHNEVKNI